MSTTSTARKSTRPAEDFDWKVSLNGKVIAITGANRGIGLSIARVCLENGASSVYSLDISDPDEEYQAEHGKYGNRLHYIQCDVTSEESVKTAIDRVVEESGTMHGFVANAGLAIAHKALDIDAALVHKLFSVNVFGVYICAVAAAKKFIELDMKGSIVFTSSMSSYGATRTATGSVYGATKAAVSNAVKTLAVEWAVHGIRVNGVSPGFTETRLTTFYKERPDWEETMRSLGGMARMADPRETGMAYVFLLSDAASYISGVDIPAAGCVRGWG